MCLCCAVFSSAMFSRAILGPIYYDSTHVWQYIIYTPFSQNKITVYNTSHNTYLSPAVGRLFMILLRDRIVCPLMSIISLYTLSLQACYILLHSYLPHLYYTSILTPLVLSRLAYRRAWTYAYLARLAAFSTYVGGYWILDSKDLVGFIWVVACSGGLYKHTPCVLARLGGWSVCGRVWDGGWDGVDSC